MVEKRLCFQDRLGNPFVNGDVVRMMFPSETDEDFACRTYALRCICHRLRKFGFESEINNLDPRTMLLLGAGLGGEPGKRVVEEAVRKTAGCEIEFIWQTVDHEVART